MSASVCVCSVSVCVCVFFSVSYQCKMFFALDSLLDVTTHLTMFQYQRRLDGSVGMSGKM